MYNEWNDWQVLVVLETTPVMVRYSLLSLDEADLWLFPAGESGDKSDYGLAKKGQRSFWLVLLVFSDKGQVSTPVVFNDLPIDSKHTMLIPCSPPDSRRQMWNISSVWLIISSVKVSLSAPFSRKTVTIESTSFQTSVDTQWINEGISFHDYGFWVFLRKMTWLVKTSFNKPIINVPHHRLVKKKIALLANNYKRLLKAVLIIVCCLCIHIMFS